MNRAPSCSLTTDLEGLKAYFSLLGPLGCCGIYIKSISWHHILIILATILYHIKFCGNNVEAGSKRPKFPKFSSRSKNGLTWENNISTVTVLLTLTYVRNKSNGVIYHPVNEFSKLSILAKLLLAKNVSN